VRAQNSSAAAEMKSITFATKLFLRGQRTRPAASPSVALAMRRGHRSRRVPGGGVTGTVTGTPAAGDVQGWRLDSGMSELTVCYLCT